MYKVRDRGRGEKGRKCKERVKGSREGEGKERERNKKKCKKFGLTSSGEKFFSSYFKFGNVILSL